MKRLIQWSIEHHWMVLALAVLLAGAGLWTARSMPVDVFPDLTAPTVTILAEGRGMAPEEMETLVTFPIEAAINGASGVRRVRSATAVGIAVVWVEFDWGTDIFLARQLVAEKLSLVTGSPASVAMRAAATAASTSTSSTCRSLAERTSGAGISSGDRSSDASRPQMTVRAPSRSSTRMCA